MRGSRVASGAVLVGGLLVLGAGMAVVARALRVPGTVPRVRLFPAEEEARELERRARLGPGALVPPRLAARLGVADAGSGAPRTDVAVRAAGSEEVRAAARVAPGILLVDFGPAPDAAPATAAVAVLADEMPPRVARIPVAVSRRADGLDAPLTRMEIPAPPEGRGAIVIAVRAEGGGPAPAPVAVLLHRVHDPQAPCSGARPGEVDPAAAGGGVFAGLRAGPWRVEAVAEGPSGPVVLAAAGATVERGGRAEAALVLPAAVGVLDLAVEDPGAPGASPPVLFLASAAAAPRELGGPGRRRLLLAAGAFRARVVRPGREAVDLAFDLVPGATIERKVVLRPAPAGGR